MTTKAFLSESRYPLALACFQGASLARNLSKVAINGVDVLNDVRLQKLRRAIELSPEHVEIRERDGTRMSVAIWRGGTWSCMLHFRPCHYAVLMRVQKNATTKWLPGADVKDRKKPAKTRYPGATAAPDESWRRPADGK
jgi:hypothetical protein